MVGSEVWEYADSATVPPTGTATLQRVQIVCPDCNVAIHIGSSAGRGEYQPALEHLARVNGITIAEADRLARLAIQMASGRTQTVWLIVVAAELLERYPELAILHHAVPKVDRPRLGLH